MCFVLENSHCPLGGGGIPADVIWGKNMTKEKNIFKKKEENGNIGQNWEVKG
jgi:hypothetical protein